MFNYCSISPVPCAHSAFLNASFQIKDNKRKMGPALPILQNLDCVDQIWIKINHPSLVSSNIFIPLVKIGFFVKHFTVVHFPLRWQWFIRHHSSKIPNTFQNKILCSIVFMVSVKILLEYRGNILMISKGDLWNVIW